MLETQSLAAGAGARTERLWCLSAWPVSVTLKHRGSMEVCGQTWGGKGQAHSGSHCDRALVGQPCAWRWEELVA